MEEKENTELVENTETKSKKKIDKKEIWRAIKYTLFAISAGLVEMGTFAIFSNLPGYYPEKWYWVAAASSLTLSVIWNFTFNRKFTFQSANNIPIAMLKTLAYYVVFGPLSIWFAQMYLIDTLGWGDWELLIKAIVMFVNFVTEFLYQRFFVFGKSIDTKPLKFKKKKEKEEQPSSNDQEK